MFTTSLAHRCSQPCFSDVSIGHVFYRWPEMAKCFFFFLSYLSSTFCKIIHMIACELLTCTSVHFSVSWWSYRELARLAILLIQRSHEHYSGKNYHTGRLQFPSWKITSNLNGKKATHVPGIVVTSLFMFRGPIWARSTVQKSNLPTCFIWQRN